MLALVAGVIALSSTTAFGQADERSSFPEQYTLSPLGVNVQTGRFVHQATDLQIGDLAFVRAWGDESQWAGNNLRSIGIIGGFNRARLGWNHSLNGGTQLKSDANGVVEAVVEGNRFSFYSLSNDAGYVPHDNKTSGASASVDANGWLTVVDQAGGAHTFFPHPALTQPSGVTANRRIAKTVRPDGTEIVYSYRTDAQVQDVRSSRGYGIHLDYDANGNISTVCGYNLVEGYRAEPTPCSVGLPTVSCAYGLANSGQLISATMTTGDTITFQYQDYAANGLYDFITCISVPNQPTCGIENFYGVVAEYPLMFPDQINRQRDAVGNEWLYGFEPPPDPNDVPYFPGMPRYSYAWVTGSGGGSFIFDRGLLVDDVGSEGHYNYKYKQEVITSGVYTFDIQDTRPALMTLPDGGREYRLYTRRNLVQTYARWPNLSGLPSTMPYAEPERELCCIKPGLHSNPAGSISVGWAYKPDYTPNPPFVTGCGAGLVDAKTCNGPIAAIDANGRQTDYEYYPEHGGIKTETGPAVNGIRPQKRYYYLQRYARYYDVSGQLTSAATPVWLLDSVSFCKAGAYTVDGCLTVGDEVVARYEYGPDSAGNNLLLRGRVADANGSPVRTCYTYDWRGNRVSETKPIGNAGISACP